MRIWITGGGSREPIDDVRYVGNYSTGRLSTVLVHEALARGHEVCAFLSSSVPSTLLPERTGFETLRFESSAELRSLLTESRDEPHAILHSAAVADYAPEQSPGKVPSGRTEWTVKFRALPKIAPELRARFPSAVLLLFKLESGISPEQLHERAHRALLASGADLIFANLLEEVQEEHQGWLLAPGPTVVSRLSGRRVIAQGLLEAVEAMHRTGHDRTGDACCEGGE